MSLPRMVVGNFINCLAVARAWKMYLAYLFRGKALAWDKTMHEFPSGAQLARKRQRLGELLQQWNAVAPEKLEKALEVQAATTAPLGRVLVSNGWLDEETLAEAIAYQADLPRAHLTADLVRNNANHLPIELAVRHRTVHIGHNKAGRSVLAVSSPLSEDAVREITEAIGEPPVQRVARDGELAIALRLLSDLASGHPGATAPVPIGPLLGDMLIERGLLKRDQFEDAMRDYRPEQHGRIGDYLVDRKVIVRDVLEQVVQEQRRVFAEAGQAT
jgi:adsorption protein B